MNDFFYVVDNLLNFNFFLIFVSAFGCFRSPPHTNVIRVTCHNKRTCSHHHHHNNNNTNTNNTNL